MKAGKEGRQGQRKSSPKSNTYRLRLLGVATIVVAALVVAALLLGRAVIVVVSRHCFCRSEKVLRSARSSGCVGREKSCATRAWCDSSHSSKTADSNWPGLPRWGDIHTLTVSRKSCDDCMWNATMNRDVRWGIE